MASTGWGMSLGSFSPTSIPLLSLALSKKKSEEREKSLRNVELVRTQDSGGVFL